MGHGFFLRSVQENSRESFWIEPEKSVTANSKKKSRHRRTRDVEESKREGYQLGKGNSGTLWGGKERDELVEEAPDPQTDRRTKERTD